jgi:hypothetical protein
MNNYKHIRVPNESVWKINQSALFTTAHTRRAYASGEKFLNHTWENNKIRTKQNIIEKLQNIYIVMKRTKSIPISKVHNVSTKFLV